MIELIFIFLFGLLIGSFLNVCIYRLPANQSIAYPASHCMACGHPLKALDLIPVLSWLFLRGKCRYCGEHIVARYAVVELLTGGLFVMAFCEIGLGAELLRALALASFLVVITMIDYDCQLILHKVVLSMAVVGVLLHIAYAFFPLWGAYLPPGFSSYVFDIDWLDALLGALTGGGLIFAIAVLSRGGMGFGDATFSAALGLWFGWQSVLMILFLSFLLGGVIGSILILTKIKGRKEYVPFGPFIAVAAWIAYLYGPEIWRLYWGLVM